MKRSTPVIGLFCLLGIGAVIFGVREAVRYRSERAARVDAERELAAMRAQLEAASRRVAEAARTREALAVTLRKRQASAEAAAAASGDPSDLAAGDTRSLSFYRNPTLRALYLKKFGLTLDPTWGPLFAKLNLSADQIAQFKAIKLANQESVLDLRAAMENQGIPETDPVYSQMRAQIGAELSQQMRSLLGSQYPTYSAYNHDQAVLPIVGQLATTLYSTDAPLTLSQSDQLVQLLSRSSQTRKYGFVIPNTINWNTVLSQASATFSPTQLSALQNYQVQQQTAQQLRQVTTAIGQSIPAPVASK